MFLAFLDQVLPTLIIFGVIILAIVIVYFVFFAPRHRAGRNKIGISKIDEDGDEVIEAPVEVRPVNLNKETVIADKDVLAQKNEELTDDKKAVETSEKTKEEVKVKEPLDAVVDDIDIPEELSVEEEKQLIPEDSLEVLEEEMEDRKEQVRLVKEKEKEEKREQNEQEETKELGKYHVLYRKDDNKWYIKREGSDKTLRVLETQAEAIAWATIKALNQDTTIVIHKRDGKIRKQNY